MNHWVHFKFHIFTDLYPKILEAPSREIPQDAFHEGSIPLSKFHHKTDFKPFIKQTEKRFADVKEASFIMSTDLMNQYSNTIEKRRKIRFYNNRFGFTEICAMVSYIKLSGIGFINTIDSYINIRKR